MTPSNTASHPADVMPATIADSSIVPEMRVSRPTISTRRCCPAESAAAPARPTSKASSGVNSVLATPRMPSVPKRLNASLRLAAGDDVHLDAHEIRSDLQAGDLAALRTHGDRTNHLVDDLGLSRKCQVDANGRDLRHERRGSLDGYGRWDDANAGYDGRPIGLVGVVDGQRDVADFHALDRQRDGRGTEALYRDLRRDQFDRNVVHPGRLIGEIEHGLDFVGFDFRLPATRLNGDERFTLRKMRDVAGRQVHDDDRNRDLLRESRRRDDRIGREPKVRP